MTASRILDRKGWTVFTVAQSASLQQAVDALAQHRVGVLVVTGDNGALAGIVSERDVIRALSGDAAAALSKTVAEVMTADIATCAPDDPEPEIMERMNAIGVRHLPVIADGRLAGLVSMRDVIRLRIEKIEDMMQSIRHEAERLK